MIDPRTVVRKKYPKAVSLHFLAVQARGQMCDTGGGTWQVYQADNRLSDVLGFGNSEQKAWADAAAKLPKD
jgi:hypothetical protein